MFLFHVSEEVFNAAEAMWFSPKGTYLAVALFNDTDVESAIYPYYGDSTDIDNQYPELVEFKYPKVSTKLCIFSSFFPQFMVTKSCISVHLSEYII